MVNDTFGMSEFVSEITEDEGRRKQLYFDTAMPPRASIGVGRNLTDVGLSADEVDLLLRNDIDRAATGLDGRVTWWRALPNFAQRVMLNLAFNMGIGKLMGFPHFLAAMERQDWDAAKMELRSSLWYHQVGERGPRMLQRLTPPVVG